MKQGYLVGYIFNRYNTLESCCFLVQTNDKKVAQAVAKKWCAFHKKNWYVYKYHRTFTCKVTENNIHKHWNSPCYILSWDRLGGTYRVWQQGYFTGAIV